MAEPSRPAAPSFKEPRQGTRRTRGGNARPNPFGGEASPVDFSKGSIIKPPDTTSETPQLAAEISKPQPAIPLLPRPSYSSDGRTLDGTPARSQAEMTDTRAPALQTQVPPRSHVPTRTTSATTKEDAAAAAAAMDTTDAPSADAPGPESESQLTLAQLTTLNDIMGSTAEGLTPEQQADLRHSTAQSIRRATAARGRMREKRFASASERALTVGGITAHEIRLWGRVSGSWTSRGRKGFHVPVHARRSRSCRRICWIQIQRGMSRSDTVLWSL